MTQAYTSVMKFTVDGRPYIKEIHDLFSALITQIKFDTHRYLFRNYEKTFSSDDAIKVLGSLQFSQSVCAPDSKDPSRVVTTITTTTFNMERGVAKALCQQFLWSRLMSNAVDSSSRSFRDRGIWQITPKGLSVLSDFCQRTRTDHPILHGIKRLNLVTLDRSDDDQLLLNRQSMAPLFRTLVNGLSSTTDDTQQHKEQEYLTTTRRHSIGSTHSLDSSPDLSESSTTTSGESTTMSDLSNRLKLLDNRLLKSASSVVPVERLHTLFSTQQCCDWLVSFCTIASRDEAEMVATEFLRHGWISYQNEHVGLEPIQSSKATLVVVTTKGRQLILDTPNQPTTASTSTTMPTIVTVPELIPTPPTTIQNVTMESAPSSSHVDGGSARLMMILEDPQLRSLFTDFLHANFCSENLNFWIDYNNLRRKCKMPSQNQKDLLEDAYAMWSTYLSPGAKWELNVDHDLQKELARLVPSMMTLVPSHYYPPTMINTSSQSNSQCLRTLLKRLDQVQAQVCRLMSNDSVPKFVAWLGQTYHKKDLGVDMTMMLKI